MSISVACPECSKRLKAPERLAGHKVKCPKCSHSWRLPLSKGKSKLQMPIADESRAASVTAIRKGRSASAKSTITSGSSKKKTPVKTKPSARKSSAAKNKRKSSTKKSATQHTKKVAGPSQRKRPPAEREFDKKTAASGTARAPKSVDKPKAKPPPPPSPPDDETQKKSGTQKDTGTQKKSGDSPARRGPPPVQGKTPPERKAVSPAKTTPPPSESIKPTADKALPGTPAATESAFLDTPLVSTASAEAATVAVEEITTSPPDTLSSESSVIDGGALIETEPAETTAEPQSVASPTDTGTAPLENATPRDAVGSDDAAEIDRSASDVKEDVSGADKQVAESTRADQRWSNADSSVPAATLATPSPRGEGASTSPNEASDTAPAAATSDEPTAVAANDIDLDENVSWFVQTYLGEQFGPLVKLELDDWVTQGRLTGDCHVFHEGWEEWREARNVYPELALVRAEDDEIELAFAETENVERTVSASETAWYTVRTGLTLINNSFIVAIVAFLLMTVGYFADRAPLDEMYFGIMNETPIDPDEGGGLVSMVLVSWGVIGMFMAFVGVLVGVIACLAIPRRTKLHPYAVGAVAATSLLIFMAVLLFTAGFLSLGPIAERLNVDSAVKTLLGVTPWAFFLCTLAAMSAIVVFVGMLAEYLDEPRLTRQMRWFGILQGAFLFWVLIDAAIVPDDSDAAFAIALFIFLVGLIASLSWVTYLTRAARDAIRPS